MSVSIQAFLRSALAVVVTVCASSPRAEPVPWDAYSTDVDSTITRLVAEIELFRFRDEQLAAIRSLAHQEGVAVICPGFETDETKLTEFLSQIVPMRDEEVRTASIERIVLRSNVMFAFGTHFGATIAMGKADPVAFCARAERDRRDPGLVTRIWR